MDLKEHQDELRRAYVRGGPGAVVSGLVWLVAAIASIYSSVSFGFGVLFFGGMLIFPISKMVLALFFQRDSESKDNPGGLIVIETVFPMIGCLFAAWLLLPHRPELVIAVSAIAVGAHYFGFRTAYGDWSYWVLGSVLCAVGFFSILLQIPSAKMLPFVVSAIEILFGCWLTVWGWKDVSSDAGELQE